ncbi:MAG TPA: acylphosphatase [bacterium]|nr:acylphosphatase [bacterium]
MPFPMERWHYMIRGNVQGVGFRWYATDIARKCRVYGWVKNLPDGAVEIVAEAESNVLESFTEKIKTGYLGSNISSMDIKKEPATGEFSQFQILF